jgi:hypothetical protein
MAAVTLSDDCSGFYIERRKQGPGPVAPIVMAAALRLAGSHRQQRLRAVQGLNLGLLVDAQHHGPIRRIEVETYDIAHLIDKQRILGQLEGFRSMRLQAEGTPDPADRAAAEAGLFR